MVQKDDITGISISFEADGELRLFIQLTSDGSINRMGSGELDNREVDLYKGRTSEPIFSHLLDELPDDFLENAGVYRVPYSKGIPLAMIISLQAGREALALEFYFGSDSMGIPSEIIQFVQKARELTEGWYRTQIKVTSDD
jgi:hypothetical protein